MASGACVVASDIVPNRELIRHGVTGILTPVGTTACSSPKPSDGWSTTLPGDSRSERQRVMQFCDRHGTPQQARRQRYWSRLPAKPPRVRSGASTPETIGPRSAFIWVTSRITRFELSSITSSERAKSLSSHMAFGPRRSTTTNRAPIWSRTARDFRGMHLEYTIGLGSLVPLLRRRQEVDVAAWVGGSLRISLHPPTHLIPMVPDGCDNEIAWTRDFRQTDREPRSPGGRQPGTSRWRRHSRCSHSQRPRRTGQFPGLRENLGQRCSGRSPARSSSANPEHRRSSRHPSVSVGGHGVHR